LGDFSKKNGKGLKKTTTDAQVLPKSARKIPGLINIRSSTPWSCTRKSKTDFQRRQTVKKGKEQSSKI